jgi:hypothetical protein
MTLIRRLIPMYGLPTGQVCNAHQCFTQGMLKLYMKTKAPLGPFTHQQTRNIFNLALGFLQRAGLPDPEDTSLRIPLLLYLRFGSPSNHRDSAESSRRQHSPTLQ